MTLAPTLEKTRSKRNEIMQELQVKNRNLFRNVDFKHCVPEKKEVMPQNGRRTHPTQGPSSRRDANNEEKTEDLDVEIFDSYIAGSVQQEVLSSEIPPEYDIFDMIQDIDDESE